MHWKNFGAGVLLLSASLTGTALAADWPQSAVTWVVPYPAGGGSDVIARLVAKQLESSLGQTLIVENKPGAATIIGATYVGNAKPDGYTVGTADSGTLAFNSSLYSKLQYDPAAFTYVGGLARFPLMLAVPQESPYKTVADLLEAARKQPEKLTSSSAGSGSPHHLALEMFKQRTDTKIVHVPYKGAAPAIQDLLGGQVDMSFVDSAAALSNIKAGKLRVLAVATPERSSLLPDVPTMAEAGIADFYAYAWQGLVGPPKMDEGARQRLSQDLMQALKAPELDQRIREMGVEPMPMTPDEFQAYAQRERAEWATVIERAGIRMD
ncbi:tripartite tricarboxylate transporter substrate binding protein [Alcaligenes phenolicus]|uniref:Bug family tripartite tricarboxylate transporter substrate binding protein n=1 Tax=Alcaligenes phenolicus TaxID=232846 RepID=UPI002AA62338|nr:tripartite tricarboxylate transporter substrate binding protein [Alcaligenes phenolicus]